MSETYYYELLEWAVPGLKTRGIVLTGSRAVNKYIELYNSLKGSQIPLVKADDYDFIGPNKLNPLNQETINDINYTIEINSQSITIFNKEGYKVVDYTLVPESGLCYYEMDGVPVLEIKKLLQTYLVNYDDFITDRKEMEKRDAKINALRKISESNLTENRYDLKCVGIIEEQKSRFNLDDDEMPSRFNLDDDEMQENRQLNFDDDEMPSRQLNFDDDEIKQKIARELDFYQPETSREKVYYLHEPDDFYELALMFDDLMQKLGLSSDTHALTTAQKITMLQNILRSNDQIWALEALEREYDIIIKN